MGKNETQWEWIEKEPSILTSACVLWSWAWRTFTVSWISIYVFAIAMGVILTLIGHDVSSVAAVMITFGPFIYIVPILFHVMFGLFFMERFMRKGLGRARIAVYKKVKVEENA